MLLLLSRYSHRTVRTIISTLASEALMELKIPWQSQVSVSAMADAEKELSGTECALALRERITEWAFIASWVEPAPPVQGPTDRSVHTGGGRLGRAWGQCYQRRDQPWMRFWVLPSAWGDKLEVQGMDRILAKGQSLEVIPQTCHASSGCCAKQRWCKSVQ